MAPIPPYLLEPKTNGYYLATLASVSHGHDELVIVVETEGKLFQSTFGRETVLPNGDIQPENVVAMIQQKTGELMLDVLKTELPESG